MGVEVGGRAPTRRLLLYGKPGCCLCDEAKPVAAKLARSYGLTLESISILDDPDAFRAYRHRIPVLVLDGVVLDEGKVSESTLWQAMRARHWAIEMRRSPST